MDINEHNNKHNAYVYALLSNLPNLQHFNSSRSSCILPITKALLNSKLNNLKTFGKPRDIKFSTHYVTCVLLMENRLQNVILAGEGELYDRLHDRLHQFEKLEKIIISRKFTNPLKELDLIVNKCCSSLRELHVQMNNKQPMMVDERSITLLCTPKPQVLTLSIRVKEEVHHSLLAYVEHKYPNLKNFNFKVERVEILDKLALECLSAYLSKVKQVFVGYVVTDVKSLCAGVGSYWEATRLQNPVRPVSLYIEQSGMSMSDTTTASFQFNDNARRIETSIFFPSCNYGLVDVDLFEKYGQHIGIVQFSDCKSWNEGITILQKSIAPILMFSQHLWELRFYMCDIKRMDERIVIKRSASLRHLLFRGCGIGDGVFDSIFGGINHIDRLTLYRCKNRENNNLTSILNVNLPNTTIGNISITDHCNPHPNPHPYLLLSISKFDEATFERVKSYYIYDRKMATTDYCKVISESEYKDEKYSLCTRFDLSCRSITSLDIRSDGYSILLPAVGENM
ncbi:unnamed protein product [Mucor hiemalis]